MIGGSSMPVQKLQIPAIGWQAVFAPCSECLDIVQRASKGSPYSGQQVDCYSCQNRLTVTRIEQIGKSMTDELTGCRSIEIGHDLGGDWTVVELSFDTRKRSDRQIENWMVRHELEGFEKVDRKMEWSIFASGERRAASVLVLLDDGVVGRCLNT
jgi:hypothetical protein